MSGAGAGAGAGGARETDAKNVRDPMLAELAASGSIPDSTSWGDSQSFSQSAVDGAILSLTALGYVTNDPIRRRVVTLTERGTLYKTEGHPALAVFRAVPADGILEDDLKRLFASRPDYFVQEALKYLNKNRFLRAEKVDAPAPPAAPGSTAPKPKKTKRYFAADPPMTVDPTLESLTKVQNDDADSLDKKEIAQLKKEKLVDVKENKVISFSVKKGPKFVAKFSTEAGDLTKEMILDGSWATTAIKKPNLEALGVDVGGGHLHLLLKCRTEFRNVLLEMGFSEMPTARFVESSFWNFDALFQPQSHPARDAHDTFFLKTPKTSLSFPEDYLERVKKMHEEGSRYPDGSINSLGYRVAWKREEASLNLLRTHTTAVSARMLYEIANQEGGFKPCKLFSIDRVFRNETLDATHLAEFHQIEGVVADYDLSLGDLIGVITEFFSRVGIKDIKLKSAYNPYTEPSMEIFASHPVLGLSEIGNSGVFRPEMLEPMGLPKGVRVIAWGLSLERPTMINYGFDNIRDLFGHKVSVDMAKHAPVVRLDKFEK